MWEGQARKLSWPTLWYYHRLDSSGSVQRPVVGSSEHGNEQLDSIRCGKFLDQQNDYKLLRKDCAMEFVC